MNIHDNKIPFRREYCNFLREVATFVYTLVQQQIIPDTLRFTDYSSNNGFCNKDFQIYADSELK